MQEVLTLSLIQMISAELINWPPVSLSTDSLFFGRAMLCAVKS